jgi:hypothetical protein
MYLLVHQVEITMVRRDGLLKSHQPMLEYFPKDREEFSSCGEGDIS